MSTVGNPINAIPESGLLRERINNNYPLSKGNERVPDKKANGEDKTSEFTHDIFISKDVPEKTASKSKTKLKVSETNLGFVYDGEVKKAILRILDEKTKKVVFQVPPEEVITKMKEDLKKENKEVPAGIIVDKKV
ncbi:MAG TPA: flagellar protein FlaG [Candidatus Brocadiales bacterium]|nr:flagellar protein FlaG [Candidatus Brocadiales bacterium]